MKPENMKPEDIERQERQKRDLTVTGVVVILSLFVASFVIDDTDKAFMWGFGVGIGLSALYFIVRHMLDKREDEEEE